VTTNKVRSPLPVHDIPENLRYTSKRHIPEIILGIILLSLLLSESGRQKFLRDRMWHNSGRLPKFFRSTDWIFIVTQMPTSDFPGEGWVLFYPPIWLLITRLSLLFTPSSQVIYIAGNAIANPSWRLALKIPIIAADLAIDCCCTGGCRVRNGGKYCLPVCGCCTLRLGSNLCLRSVRCHRCRFFS